MSSEIEERLQKLEEFQKSIERTLLENAVESTALFETIGYLSKKAGLDELEILTFWENKKKEKLDSLLTKIEDHFPDRAAELDKRNIDDVPTD